MVYKVIIDPAGAACEAIVYMNTPAYSCDEEAYIPEISDVATVLAALTPPYTAHAGFDYRPNQLPPPLVSISDLLGGGSHAAHAVECASKCTAEPTCNAATYYGDIP